MSTFDPSSTDPRPATDGRPAAGPSRRRAPLDAYFDGELIRTEQDLEHLGETVAVASGRREVDEAALAALREEADRAAARLAAVPYDAQKHPGDQLYRERYDRDGKKLEQLESALDHAVANLRDAERALAGVEAPPAGDPWAGLMALLGLVGVAFSVGMTLHDVVFAYLFAASAPALAASFGAGALLAGVSVLGMINAARHAQPKAAWEGWAWLFLGVSFGLAVLAMRAYVAETPEQHLLAVGFAAIEIVSVLSVKLYAVSLHREVVELRGAQAQRRRGEEAVRAAERQVADVRARIAALEDRMEAHRGRVETRTHRSLLAEAVRAAARAAAEAGYRRGLARNQGHLDGAALPPLTHIVTRRAPEAK